MTPRVDSDLFKIVAMAILKKKEKNKAPYDSGFHNDKTQSPYLLYMN